MKPHVKNNAFDRAMNQAVAHHRAGNLAGAEEHYRLALRAQPLHADALRLLGTLYLQTGRSADARQMLTRAQGVQSDNPEIANNLGLAAQNCGDREQAMELFRRALDLRPGYKEAIQNLDALSMDLKAVAAPVSAEVLRQRLQSDQGNVTLWVEFGLALQRESKVEEAIQAYEQALTLEPQRFSALINLATAFRDTGHAEQALEKLQAAQKLQPQSLEMLINLGAVYWDLNRLDRAIDSYDEGLKFAPDNAELLINRGSVLWAAGRAQEAEDSYRHALKVSPNHADALTNLGALAHDKNDLDEANDFYDRALLAQPGFARAAWRKSLILLARGEYGEGWKLYEAGYNVPGLRGLSHFQGRLWDGEPVKRLLIHSEQGLGDALQFIRYAALCRDKAETIIALCPQPLVRLFAASPNIDTAQDRITDEAFDAQISVMSLPSLFGTTMATVPAKVPYLKTEDAVQREWDKHFSADGRLKIGLVWAGNAREGQVNANLTDRRRSLSLAAFAPLFAVPGAQFYNLQKGPPAEQLAQSAYSEQVIDLMPQARDFMDTACIVNNLDLVITVDTSVAHLAGGLGKPVWVLSRFDACWRWLENRPDNQWYPTTRVFGQTTPGDWPGVMGAVRLALDEAVHAYESRGSI